VSAVARAVNGKLLLLRGNRAAIRLHVLAVLLARTVLCGRGGMPECSPFLHCKRARDGKRRQKHFLERCAAALPLLCRFVGLLISLPPPPSHPPPALRRPVFPFFLFPFNANPIAAFSIRRLFAVSVCYLSVPFISPPHQDASRAHG